MVSVLVTLSVVLPCCGTGLVALRWWLAHQAAARQNTSFADLDKRLQHVEQQTRALSLGKLRGQ